MTTATIRECIYNDGEHSIVAYRCFDVGNTLHRRTRCWDCGTLLSEEVWTSSGYVTIPRDAWTITGREEDNR